MTTQDGRWKRSLLVGLAALTMAACAPQLTPAPAEQPAAEAPAATAPASVVEARIGAATPEEAARAFYDWYLEYTRPSDGGDFRNPLVDGAYADSPYLTADLAERVGEILASSEGGGYDPFLCAQDVPTAFTLGPVEAADGEARLSVYTTFVGHAFDVTLVEDNGGWLLDEVACALPDPTTRTPEEVVDSFYSWWINYPGNPLAEQTYQGAGLYLTPGFIEQISATVASFDKGGYDPILLAQDVPTTVEIVSSTVEGGLAQVMVRTDLMGHELAVSLQQDGGIWKIAGVTRAGEAQGPGPAEVAETPEDAVRAFYAWYLEYCRPSEGGEGKNPLVDQAYADSPYLFADLVARVNDIIASFDRNGPGGGYDPFLCAQDVPTAFTVAPAEGDGGRAHTTVYTSFAGHWFDVSLVKGDVGWQLNEIACTNPDPTTRTPEQVVSDFYAWYVHYPGNPLVDKAYYGAGLFLTPGLIEEIDAIVASFDKGGFDPLLLAQDVPGAVTAEPAVIDGDTATVVVSTSFEGHTFTVRLVKDGPIWKIDGVTEGANRSEGATVPDDGDASDMADWRVFRHEHYAVQLMYPSDWAAQEARIQDPQSFRPIVSVANFGAKDVEGRQMLASLEISEGSLEEVLRLCSLEADAVKAVEVGGRTMRVGTNPYGETFYVLQSPYADNVWATLRDSMTWENPSEADQALKAAVEGMVETLAFDE